MIFCPVRVIYIMDTETGRKMPYSLEAEQSLLASVIIDPSCMNEITGMVRYDDFYLSEHAEIYSIMTRMYASNQNIDHVTLIDEMKKLDVYDKAGGEDYLKLIISSVPSAINARDYAKIIHDKAVLRKLIKASEEITEAAYSEEGDPSKLVEYAESKIYAISDDREDRAFVSLSDALTSVLGTLKKQRESSEAIGSVRTGFTALDNVIVGFGETDLVLIGARPGMGKTTFAMNIATSIAEMSKKTVCVFSLEMSATQLAMRMLSSEAQVDSTKLRSGSIDDQDWEAIAYASSKLASMNILIDDTPGITVSGIKSKLRRCRDRNIGMVIIDYLQLMQSDSTRSSDSRVLEIGDISRGLKLLAKEMNIPVVTCAQLSRAPEKRDSKRPMLSDLRDSGAIEQDADIVMFLYRDDYYKEDSDNENITEVIIAKNRHGAVDKVKLGWIAQYSKFTNLSGKAE